MRKNSKWKAHPALYLWVWMLNTPPAQRNGAETEEQLCRLVRDRALNQYDIACCLAIAFYFPESEFNFEPVKYEILDRYTVSGLDKILRLTHQSASSDMEEYIHEWNASEKRLKTGHQITHCTVCGKAVLNLHAKEGINGQLFCIDCALKRIKANF